jgi:hypothetical protein
MVEWHATRLESGLGQPSEPVAPREEALDVTIVLDADRPIALAQQIGIVDEVCPVGRVWIPGPFQIAQSSLPAIVTAVIGRRMKRLADVIGREESGTTRPTVHEHRFDRLAQILFRSHVHDGVVYEDAIELSSQPDGAHVTDDMLTLGIERAADLEHPGGGVDEEHVEASFEM